METLISIIVPVYNVEKYLNKCIDSILNQTYRNIEVILVDDGSPDNCGKICDEYAMKDKRVKVIHIENKGVSNARNVGVENSTGQYIGFVDADDILFKKMYEKLLNEAVKEDADIVQCNYCYLFEDGTTKPMIRKIKTKKVEKEQKITAFFDGDIYPLVATKLFKSSLLNDIRFDINLKIGEDRLFMHECCLKALKIALLEDVYYYYFQRQTSVMHVFSMRQFDDDTYVSQLFLNQYKNNEYICAPLEYRIIFQSLNLICELLNEQKELHRFFDVREKLVQYKKTALLSKKIPIKMKAYILGLWIMPNTFMKVYPKLKILKDKNGMEK